MKKLTLLLLTFLSSSVLSAQGTINDYNRAFSLPDRLKDKVFYSNVTPQWIGKTDRCWYIRYTPQGKTYMLTDAQRKTNTALSIT